MSKYSINSKLLYKAIALENITNTNCFFLKSVAPIKVWEDGKATDRIEGYAYDVIDPVNFDSYKIKVPGQLSPLISEERLQQAKQAGKQVLVSFIGATVTLYLNQNKEMATDSYKATDVKFFEKGE